jgi:hypothetical protein
MSLVGTTCLRLAPRVVRLTVRRRVECVVWCGVLWCRV